MGNEEITVVNEEAPETGSRENLVNVNFFERFPDENGDYKETVYVGTVGCHGLDNYNVGGE